MFWPSTHTVCVLRFATVETSKKKKQLLWLLECRNVHLDFPKRDGTSSLTLVEVGLGKSDKKALLVHSDHQYGTWISTKATDLASLTQGLLNDSVAL